MAAQVEKIDRAAKFYANLTVEEQRELFLWKYRDVSRDAVTEMMKDFIKHDITHRGELDEHEAAMLLEHRGAAKTASELREMISSMDSDNNHRLSFVEWCCAYFEKSYEELNDFTDEDARQAALLAARTAGEEAKQAELAIEKAKQQKELQAQLRAAAIERESKLTGIEGMKAFFLRKAENTVDTSKTNEQQIKEEAARRKALREAKLKYNEAITQSMKTKSPEELAEELHREAERQAAAEAAAIKKAEEDEKAARAARKAALNAKWGGSSDKIDKSGSSDKN